MADRSPPFVSIILPLYNACKTNPEYLLEALKSLARQSYHHFELIIVDDGSTDDSARICKYFIAEHPEMEVYYYFKKNGGQSSARNFGGEASKGEFLSFIDQDDLFYENTLESRIGQLETNTDLVYTDADIIDEKGSILLEGIHRNYGHGFPHPKKSIEDILFKDIVVMPGLMTIKKETFFRVCGFDEHLSGYEDDDLFLRIFEIGQIKYLPISSLQCRLHPNNFSQSAGMIQNRFTYYQKLIGHYTCQGTDLRRVQLISWRFFKLFLVQAMIQYRQKNVLFLENFAKAREIVPKIPWFRKLLFNPFFLFEDRKAVKWLSGVYFNQRKIKENRVF